MNNLVKKRRFSVRKFALFLIVLSIITAIICIMSYKNGIKAVSDSEKEVSFNVPKGSSYTTLAHSLKKQNLIKSEFFYKLYIKLNTPTATLTEGDYNLSESMSVSDIISTLSDKDNIVDNVTKLTFREGLNIREFAEVIASKTDFTKEEVINKINDQTYLDSLIDKYWFITEDVKNENLYYALEGYLYPDTYLYEKEELTLEKILEKILNNTENKLEAYKTQIQSSSYTVHQILTLASLVELEAVTDEDRKGVAGVFYNRLNNSWSLGSDVTTYYASKKKMTESLTKKELNDCNGYNTRCTSMKGLPIGPIDNPSTSSIDAALNPTQSSYYYFVADKNKKVYFTKNANEHEAIIKELKEKGLWLS